MESAGFVFKWLPLKFDRDEQHSDKELALLEQLEKIPCGIAWEATKP